MGFFSSIGNAFKSIGEKTLKGAGYLLDKGIQGAKIATDFADKYTLGLDHFIPYYSAIKAGIDISDHVRKMVKGEESLNWSNVIDMGQDVVFGAMSAYGGKAELEGLKGGYNMFRGARATGSGLKEALKIGGGRAIRGYGLHKEQLKEMGREGLRGAGNLGKMIRKGDPKAVIGSGLALATGSVALEQGLQGANLKKTTLNEQSSQRVTPQSIPEKVIFDKPKVIFDKPKVQIPVKNVYRNNGIYRNGRLVG